MSQLFELFEENYPRLVMFDLDGTLVDSAPDIAWCVDQMLLEMGLPEAGLDNVRTWVGNGAQKLIERTLAYYDRDTGPEAVEAALDIFKNLYRNHLAELSVLYDGVEACLQTLKDEGCILACVTNKPVEFAGPMLDELQIAGYFEMVVGGDCLPAKKPDPMPLQHVMDTFACMPEETLMVGDSRSDMVGAQNAGCRSVCVTYGYNQGENMSMYEPDLMVDSLTELI